VKKLGEAHDTEKLVKAAEELLEIGLKASARRHTFARFVATARDTVTCGRCRNLYAAL